MRDTASPNSELRALLDAALTIAHHSYSPYSGFKVGAALQLSSGAIVTGTNVENMSYGLTICAERAALVRAVAEHRPRHPHRAPSPLPISTTPPVRPAARAGRCSRNSSNPTLRSYSPAADGVRIMSFSELLPLAFEMKLNKASDHARSHLSPAAWRESPLHPVDLHPQEARRPRPHRARNPHPGRGRGRSAPFRPNSSPRGSWLAVSARPHPRRDTRAHPGHARLRRKIRCPRASARPRSTSTPPAASATRPASSSLPWPRPAVSPCP